jgi:hypothetical protein
MEVRASSAAGFSVSDCSKTMLLKFSAISANFLPACCFLNSASISARTSCRLRSCRHGRPPDRMIMVAE